MLSVEVAKCGLALARHWVFGIGRCLLLGLSEILAGAGTFIRPDGLGPSDPWDNHKGTVLPIGELGGSGRPFLAPPGEPEQKESGRKRDSFRLWIALVEF